MRTVSRRGELGHFTLRVALLLVLSVGFTSGYFNITYLKQANEGELKAALRQMIADFHSLDQPSNQIQGFPNNDRPNFLPQKNEEPNAGTIGAQVPSDIAVGVGSPQPVVNALQNLTHFLNKEQRNVNQIDGGFTQWTQWSKCPTECGRTALRSRERYCTNPAPANSGKNCEGPRFQLKLCALKNCVVDGGFTTWTAWSHCSKKCGHGVKLRHRYCTNPRPANGGKPCRGKRRVMKYCTGKTGCIDPDQSIVDIDPKAVCGYDPCKVVKCFNMPFANCLSDFRCKAVFFDSEEKKLDVCKGDQLYLSVQPERVCRFDPCKYTTCMGQAAAKCVVNTKCHPVFLDTFGKRLSCKGVFKVPARYICGSDPCNGALCQPEPTARCLVDHACKPIFVNSLDMRMKECTERTEILKDEEDEAEDQTDTLTKLIAGSNRQREESEQDVSEDADNGETENETETDKEDGSEAENPEEADPEDGEESGDEDNDKKGNIPVRFRKLNLFKKHKKLRFQDKMGLVDSRLRLSDLAKRRIKEKQLVIKTEPNDMTSKATIIRKRRSSEILIDRL